MRQEKQRGREQRRAAFTKIKQKKEEKMG